MIYFCIPAYNEEKTIGVLLWKLRQVMANFPRDYQLLVIDDASTDKTSEALRPYQRVLPLTVIRNEQRRGYATSLELLIREAARRSEYPKRDAIVTLQADFTEDPEQVVTLLKRIEAGDDIVATTPVIGEDAPWQVRWSRKLALRAIRRRGWPEAVDPLSGLRAYRVQVIRKAIEASGGKRLLTWSGWLANAELLAAAQPHSRRTESVESTYRPERHRRPSRLHPWKLVWQAIGFGRGRRAPDALAPLEALPPAQLPEKRGRQELLAYMESRGVTRDRPIRIVNGRGRDRRDQGRAAGRPRREEERRPAAEARGATDARGAGSGRGQADRRGQPERRGAADRGGPADRRGLAESRGRGGPSDQRPDRRSSTDRRQARPEGQGRPRNGVPRPESPEAIEPVATDAAGPAMLATQEALAALEETGLIPAAEAAQAGETPDPFAAPGAETPKRRRRRRGRGRGRRTTQTAENETPAADGDTSESQLELVAAGGAVEDADPAVQAGDPDPARRTGRRRRRGGRRGRGRARAGLESTQEGGADSAAVPDSGSSGPAEGVPNHEAQE